VNFTWERLSDNAARCRLPFLDVTVGVIWGRSGVLMVDAGTTLTEARAIDDDVRALTGRPVSHLVLTHNHFDHILGSPAFTDAVISCAPAVAATIADGADHLRADALRYGADPREVDRAISALRAPDIQMLCGRIDLGGVVVEAEHPGGGHTDHDLIVAAEGTPGTVVFCGDLVEESGDPAVDADSHLANWPTTLDRVLEIGGDDARYVPGHGAVVDAAFVRRQQRWLADR
jgi:glyoxylase-like metal-dependent hydrolase (beta-lactamase superfamily II)